VSGVVSGPVSGPVSGVESGRRLVYRLLIAVDIEGYSGRAAGEQLRAQEELGHVLDRAAAQADLDRPAWDREVRGDGELAVLPDGVDVPQVVGGFAVELDAALIEANRRSAPAAPLRLRVALHHGTLTTGPFGPAGDAPIVVSRLLDAARPRRQLADRREHDLVLVVSDPLYQDVVRTGFCPLDPACFRAFRVVTKGLTYRGHLFQGPVAPAAARPGGPAAPGSCLRRGPGRRNAVVGHGPATVNGAACRPHGSLR
jgi:hypothetical protein